jgi:hypothetical protein
MPSERSRAVYVDSLMDHGWRLGPSCHLFTDPGNEDALHTDGVLLRGHRAAGTGIAVRYDITTEADLVSLTRRCSVRGQVAARTRDDAEWGAA